jgi:hypothetical protein
MVKVIEAIKYLEIAVKIKALLEYKSRKLNQKSRKIQ